MNMLQELEAVVVAVSLGVDVMAVLVEVMALEIEVI